MLQLSYYNLVKSINSTAFLKKFTFIFLTWFFLTYNALNPYRKSLEDIYKQNKTLNIRFRSLLTTHERQRESKTTMLREKLPDERSYKEKRNVSHNISAYSHVKKNKSNNIDVYMKNYKHRHGKKKGLSKLDCYYENKVFRKFCDISDITKKMKYDEKRSTNFFLKKYGIGLILFALTPALGLIFPILFGVSGKLTGLLGYCDKSNHTTHGRHTDKQCPKAWLYDDIIDQISYVPLIFSFLMIIIVLLYVIYILIKVIKYEKIKSGKGKISAK